MATAAARQAPLVSFLLVAQMMASGRLDLWQAEVGMHASRVQGAGGVGAGVGGVRAGRSDEDRAAGTTASARTAGKHTKCVGLSKSGQ